jgi:23S rRNA pseudouridine2457 synthase
MVSQFISPDKVNLLGDLNYDFPEGTYALGRLDKDSEGLLLLTTNKKIKRLLFSNKQLHKRTYLLLVKGIVSQERLQQLKTGVAIKIKNAVQYTSLPCHVQIVNKPNNLPKGMFEYEQGVPCTWLTITLTEGKYHQVRKMLAAIHHPVRRLIRISIEDIELGNLQPSMVMEMEEELFYKKLHLEQLEFITEEGE